MIAQLVAATAAAGAFLVVRPRTAVRRQPPPASFLIADPEAPLKRLRPALVALAVLGGWALFGGWFGTVAGLAGGAVAWRVLERAERPAAVRRRAVLERDLPMAVHLVGAALNAGAAPSRAVIDVAEAFPGPIAEEFNRIHHSLTLGVDPVAVWSKLDGPLRSLGRTMVRAHESGASVRLAVERLADDLRAGATARVEALARSVEVRSAAPLGICFLPAFVVLGVVPMAVGIFSTLRVFG